MSGLAGIMHWDSKAVAQETIDRMLHLIRHRGPDRLRSEQRGPLALAHALRAQRRIELRQSQPVWLPGAGLAIVADATIYNRSEIRERLGPVDWFKADPSDAELILAAYQRWGEGVVDVLDGDFAFAIVDTPNRRVFAARDLFGARPLCYHWDRTGFIFASEPKQIIAAGVPPEPNDEIIGEYLFDNFQSREQTFFQHVNRIHPGCFLVATPESCSQTSYWKIDPSRETHYPRRQDYLDRFRELLKRSVAKRLETDFPILAHLSGGFDSSSVVVLAAELFREQGRDPAQLQTVSNTFPGRECDETQYSQPVADSTPFVHHVVEPLREPVWEGVTGDLWQTDGPWGADIQRGVFAAHGRLLRQAGARVLLTGIGGDEIADEPCYLRDLVARRRYLRALRDAWRMRPYAYRPWRMTQSALRGVVPAAVRRLYRSYKPGTPPFPAWAVPSFVEFYRRCSSPPRNGVQFPSLTQQVSYNCLTGAWLCWCLEFQECKWSYLRCDVRHPFLDRALAEFSLSIPFEERIPDGKFKYLLREALGPSLPPVLANRKRKTVFYAYEESVMARERERIAAELFASGRWLTANYVRREQLDPASAAGASARIRYQQFWKISTLELWFRLLASYNASPTFSREDGGFACVR